MRLTNTIRDAFIRAAMDDVPRVDHQEKAIKIVIDDAVAQLPPKIRAIYKDKDTRGFIRKVGRYFEFVYVDVPCAGSDFKLRDAAALEISKLKSDNEAQDSKNKELRSKLHAVAYSVSTRKALVDMLPEFEKYLPADDAAACRTLPAVANVVSDFVKAGWPKDKPRSSKK